MTGALTSGLGVWRPERCAGRGGGYCEPGRDPADVAAEECGADGMVPDVVYCEDPAGGLCWPCLMDLILVLDDVPDQLRDLDVGIACGLDGAAAARRELAATLEAFAGWLELGDLPSARDAAVLAPWSGPPEMCRAMTIAMVMGDYLYANADEPELRNFAREVSEASVRARGVIFIPRGA